MIYDPLRRSTSHLAVLVLLAGSLLVPGLAGQTQPPAPPALQPPPAGLPAIPALAGQATPAEMTWNWALEAAGPDQTGSTHRLVLTLVLPQDHHAFAQPDFLFLRPDQSDPNNAWLLAGQASWSSPDTTLLGQAAYTGQIQARLPLRLDTPGSRDLSLNLGWQICDETGLCYRPQTRQITLTINPALAGSPAVTETSLALPGQGPASLPAAQSLWLMLLFAFLGGLILNVMPCVLPVLSLKLLGLLDASPPGPPASQGHAPSPDPAAPPARADRPAPARSRLTPSRRKALAGLGGIFAGIMGLGVLTVVLKATGQAAGWGFQFQNPHFVLVLNLVVLAFALSLLGLWQIRLGTGPRKATLRFRPAAGRPGVPAAAGPQDTSDNGTAAQTGSPGSISIDGDAGSNGTGRAFLDGLVMVALATPCSAPFLGTATGFALTAPAGPTLLVFASLALGLGLPFFVLAWFPRLRGFLPRPGPWMDTVKTIMAFLLLGTSVWLFGISLGQVSAPAATGWLALALVLALTLWLWGQSQVSWGRAAWVRRGLALAILAGGIMLLYPFNPGQPAAAAGAAGSAARPDQPAPGGITWLEFSPGIVTAALQAGQPVFVDFGAAWCLTCGFNEKGVLADPAALAPLVEHRTVFVRGDFTSPDPHILAWLQAYGRSGVPFYQVLSPDGRNLVLPEVLGPGDLAQAAAWLGNTATSPRNPDLPPAAPPSGSGSTTPETGQ